MLQALSGKHAGQSWHIGSLFHKTSTRRRERLACLEPCLLRRRFKLPPIFLLPPGVDDCLVHFLCMYALPRTHDESAPAHPALS